MLHNKKKTLPTLIFISFVFTVCAKTSYSKVTADAPFGRQTVEVYRFPKHSFVITDYGAIPGNGSLCTQAFAKAIDACQKAGGGHVVVPRGIWTTGAIHLQSNVDLHLEEGAVISFTDNPTQYLPAVQTSWEGMECFNYSPLIYAFGCDNVAITGKGTLQPKMDNWRKWFARSATHMEGERKLYTMASTDVPVEQRQMAEGENRFRPHLIQFNRCRHVLLDGFKIRESPFWTIHMLLCDGGLVRNLDVKAHGFNNDGIDIEMTRNFIVQDCSFDQGDDAIVIKSGRNQDAWRLHTPTENIVVRNCKVIKGHCLLGIGSEISGGVRNIYLHDCQVLDSVINLYYLKTNLRRGAFLENIYMKNVKAKAMHRAFAIDTNILYQWKDVPTYEERITRIKGIHMENVHGQAADILCDINGDAKLPVNNVTLKNVRVDKIRTYEKNIVNAKNVTVE